MLKDKKPAAVCVVLRDEKENRTDRYEQEWNGLWHFCNVMQFLPEFVAVSTVGIAQMDYLALPIPAAEVSVEESSETNDGWNLIMDMLFDDDARAFAEAAKDAGIRPPEEENIGYEVEGADGGVIATVEIAWPERKLGFMTAEQLKDKAEIEATGWKVISIMDIGDISALFGGDE